MVDVSRPTVIDVTVFNPREVVYLHGNKDDPFSQRVAYDSVEEVIEVQTNGASGGETNWNPAQFEVSTDRGLRLGKDLTLGGSTGFIETFTKSTIADHQKALIPHTPFDEFGSGQSHIPQLNRLHTVVFYDNPVSEQTLTKHTQVLNAPNPLLFKTGTFLIGSTAPTATVTITFYIGETENPDTRIYSQNYAASVFSADTPVVLNFDEDFGFEQSGKILVVLESAVAFSLEIATLDNIVFSAEAHDLEILDIVSGDLVVFEDGATFNRLFFVYDNLLQPMQLGPRAVSSQYSFMG